MLTTLLVAAVLTSVYTQARGQREYDDGTDFHGLMRTLTAPDWVQVRETTWIKKMTLGGETVLVAVSANGGTEVTIHLHAQCIKTHQYEDIYWTQGSRFGVRDNCNDQRKRIAIPSSLEKAIGPLPQGLYQVLGV
jgi:hypothetical protein